MSFAKVIASTTAACCSSGVIGSSVGDAVGSGTGSGANVGVGSPACICVAPHASRETISPLCNLTPVLRLGYSGP